MPGTNFAGGIERNGGDTSILTARPTSVGGWAKAGAGESRLAPASTNARIGAGRAPPGKRDAVLLFRATSPAGLADFESLLRVALRLQSPFKGEGITAATSGILTGGWQTDRERSYVALSRAREQTQIYVAREDLGEAGMDSGAIERLAGSEPRIVEAPGIVHSHHTPGVKVADLAVFLMQRRRRRGPDPGSASGQAIEALWAILEPNIVCRIGP